MKIAINGNDNASGTNKFPINVYFIHYSMIPVNLQTK